ncbi:hypothetical protein HGB07_09335, partial [Candidatus Roizmanbacteria bacterium]|nr:hypothetical protein [Candidatus Roizmanbacteria bacterium]
MGKIKNSLQIACILILISATAFAQGRLAIHEKISGALRYWDGGLANNVKAITSNKPKATITSLPKGIPTGLTGYCDFQVNGGSPKYIAINPANPKRVHTTYMSADQGDVYGTRHVGYAYSSKDGFEWESYSSVRQAVTNTYVAFPALTLLQSQSGNAEAAIACSYTKLDNSGQLDSLRSLVFIDQYDEGVALFSQVSPSSSGFGKLQPIWPSILASNDGSKIWMMATNPGNYTSYYTVWDNISKKFGAYVGPLKTSTGYFLRSYGLYGMAISESGNKVAMCYIDVAGYINLNYTESTDGGQTFPDFTTLTPYPTVINDDTLTVFAGGDAVYVGENL